MRVLKFSFFSLLLISIYSHAQTPVPMLFSPDGTVNSIIAKGDTLIVGGDFKHVGKYTGGGALIDANTGLPDLSFPKINGYIYSSSSDGNGGFYIYGNYYRESENPSEKHYRLEHVLADNTFEPDFSFEVSSIIETNYILFHNGIIYVGGRSEQTINSLIVGHLTGINASTKSLESWLPVISRTNPSYLCEVTRIIANQNTLYFIGRFDLVDNQARQDAAAVEIGSGTVKSWNPTPNWENYLNYADLVLYKDKVILGGAFDDQEPLNGSRHACALVDTTSGQSFDYLFVSGGLFGNNGGYLYWAAWVYRLVIKGDILYAFTNGTFDTRITAIDLSIRNMTGPEYHSGYIWMKYFNMIADAEDMVIVGNSLYVMGRNFEEVFTTNNVNDPEYLEREIMGGVKLDLTTGNLQEWYPDPTDRIYGDVWTMTNSGNKIFIGGSFSHLNSQKRNGLYLYNTTSETLLSVNPGFKDYTRISAMKLDKENLYLGGDLSWQTNHDYSILGFNVNTSDVLNWFPPRLGDIGMINAIEVNDQFVFAGGRYLEEPEGGQDRINLFAIDKSTGQLNNWAPNPNQEVRALSLSHNQLFVGGDFRNISEQERNYGASYDSKTLSLTNWNPVFDGGLRALLPKSGAIWSGGNFSKVAGKTSYQLAGINTTSGTNTINSTTFLSGAPVRSLSAKGCKLFLIGDVKTDYFSPCGGLLIYDLSTNSFVPNSTFCLKLQGTSYLSNSAIIGNDLYFAGSFEKINDDTKNTHIGRIRFPADYFKDCDIGNCGQEVSLTSTVDDYTTGSYLQKTNQPISATNKVTGNSQYSLLSNSSILLLPNTEQSSGFIASPASGGNFKAEIAPCN